MTQQAALKSGPVHSLDARRAYYVFLTHLRKCHATGLRWPVETVMEIGVGTSFGIGYCSLLSGAKQYVGFDAVRHLDPAQQDPLRAQLESMFAEQAPALNDAGAAAFEFPGYIVGDSAPFQGGQLDYVAPYGPSTGETWAGQADLLLSTATLEHVDDMAGGYAMFHKMLKAGGTMSHSIDFKSHGFDRPFKDEKVWNGHWLMTSAEWADHTAGRSYSINRLACSQHLQMMIEAGFEIISIEKRFLENRLSWRDLAPEFQWMTEDDIRCSGVHVICRKP